MEEIRQDFDTDISETNTVEEIEEMEEEKTSTLDSMNPNDPIEGPAATFLGELIRNAAVPINTNQIGLFIAVKTDDDEEDEDIENNLENIKVIELTSLQKVELLKSNVQQFLALLRSHAIDFDRIKELGKEIDFESDEFNNLDDASQQYLEYLDRILAGAKSLAKDKNIQDAVIDTMSEAVSWAIKNNKEDVYEDLSKMGKLLKHITWKLVSHN